MSNDKYVALDVHQASIVAHVHDADDRCLTQAIFETRAEAISDFIRGLSGTLRVVFEEGTHSTWLYDLIKPLVAEVTVCDPRHNRLITSGSKGDQVDAHKLAHLLRLGAVRGVYKGAAGLRALKELAHSYDAVVSDLTRVKNRLKALYRGRGIACPGRAVYHLGQREVWLGRLSEPGARRRAEVLYQQLDQLRRLHREAKRALLEESRKHAATGVLRGVPGLGPVRAAQVLSEVGTPHRFRTKRQFWPYCGLAVVRRASAEYQLVGGEVRRRAKPGATRGLSRDYNRRLKRVFKSAAEWALRREPCKAYYERLLERGLRPELARVTLARKLAAVTLAVWKREAEFDAERILKQVA